MVRGRAKGERGWCLARSPLLAPSPSLFLSEEMAAGTAADTTTAFMYLLGEERGREGGGGGNEWSGGKPKKTII